MEKYLEGLLGGMMDVCLVEWFVVVKAGERVSGSVDGSHYYRHHIMFSVYRSTNHILDRSGGCLEKYLEGLLGGMMDVCLVEWFVGVKGGERVCGSIDGPAWVIVITI